MHRLINFKSSCTFIRLFMSVFKTLSEASTWTKPFRIFEVIKDLASEDYRTVNTILCVIINTLKYVHFAPKCHAQNFCQHTMLKKVIHTVCKMFLTVIFLYLYHTFRQPCLRYTHNVRNLLSPHILSLEDNSGKHNHLCLLHSMYQ